MLQMFFGLNMLDLIRLSKLAWSFGILGLKYFHLFLYQIYCGSEIY